MGDELDDDEIASIFDSDDEEADVDYDLGKVGDIVEIAKLTLISVAKITKAGVRQPVVIAYMNEHLKDQIPIVSEEALESRLKIDNEMGDIAGKVDKRMDELVSCMVEKERFYSATWAPEMRKLVGIRLAYFIGWCLMKKKFQRDDILPVNLNYIEILDEYVYFLINQYNSTNSSSFNKKVRSSGAEKETEILKRLSAQSIRGYASKAGAGLFLFGLFACRSYASHLKSLKISMKIGKSRGHLNVTNWPVMDLDVFHLMKKQFGEQNIAIKKSISEITVSNDNEEIQWISIGCLSRTLAFLFLSIKGYRFASLFGSSNDSSGQLKFEDVSLKVIHYPMFKFELEFKIGRRKNNVDTNAEVQSIFVSEDHEYDFVRLFIAYMILLDVFEADAISVLKGENMSIKREKSEWFVFPRVCEDALFPVERHDRYSDTALRTLSNYLRVPKRAIIASSWRKGYVFKLFLEELKNDPDTTKERILELLRNTPQWKGLVPRSYFITATTNFIKIREAHGQYARQAKIEGNDPPSPYVQCPLLTDVVKALGNTNMPDNKEVVQKCTQSWEKKKERVNLTSAEIEIGFLLSRPSLNEFSKRRLIGLQKTLTKFHGDIPRGYLDQYKARLIQKCYDKVADKVVAESYLETPRINVILDLDAIASHSHNKCDHTTYLMNRFSPTAFATSPVFCYIKGCNEKFEANTATSGKHIKEHFDEEKIEMCKYCENVKLTSNLSATKHFRAHHYKGYYCETCEIYDSQYHPSKKAGCCTSLKQRSAIALIFKVANRRTCNCPIDACISESNELLKFLNLHTLDVAAKLNYADVYVQSQRKAQEMAFFDIAKVVSKRESVPCAIQLFRIKYGRA